MTKYVLLASCALSLFSTNASAQLGEGMWGVDIGAGIMTTPAFLGDDEYQILAVPNIKVTYADKFFASVQDGIGYNVVNNKNWRAGPIARIDFGRDEEGNSPFRVDGGDVEDLNGLREIDSSFELGAFVEYTYRPLSFNLELRQAAGGHEGLVGSAGINYKGRAQLMNKPVFYSAGPQIQFADSNFHDAYFGVNAAESNASGLSQYEADAGILSYGAGATAIIPLTDNISTILFANYSHLGTEAANSSLVEQRGSAHQAIAGAFINYSF